MNRKRVNNPNQESLPLTLKPIFEWPLGYEEGLSKEYDGTWNVVGFDVETEGLNPYDKNRKILSFAVAPAWSIAYASYSLYDMNAEDVETLRRILENPNVIVSGHNIKYDVNWVAIKYGINVRAQLFDSAFAAYLLDENRRKNSLEVLSYRYEDLREYKTSVDRARLKDIPKQDLLIYNGSDADASRRLIDDMIPELNKQGLLPLMNASMEVLPVLSKMETRGVYLDRPWADETKFKLFEDAMIYRESINDLARMSVDPDSIKSMQTLLYKRMKMPVEVRTDTGNPATNRKAIRKALLHTKKGGRFERILRTALDYRKNIKLLSTYYQPIPRWTAFDGRVHTTYRFGKQDHDEGVGGTVTGRLSSDKPNLQNIPIGLIARGMFAATPGYIWFSGDYSQLELRVAAYLAQERLMMEAFEQGLDIHTKVMSDVTGMSYDEIQSRKDYDEDIKIQRVAVKRVNFGILYGVQAQRLQDLLWLDLGVVWPLEKCERLIAQWLDTYSAVHNWIRETKTHANNYGYVAMPFGQRRRLPEANFRTPEGRRALRQAINFPVQSTASWICLIGMMLLDRWITSNYLNAHVLMQVHDSVELEIHKSHFIREDWTEATLMQRYASNIQRVMEEDTLTYIEEMFGVKWNVPLKFEVKYGERWQ